MLKLGNLWTEKFLDVWILLVSSFLIHSRPSCQQFNDFAPLNGKCVDRCGDLSQSHCSCDVRCKVTGNCCRDFQQACPEVFEESVTVFRDFVHLIQECDPNGYLLISECPNDKRNTKFVIDEEANIASKSTSSRMVFRLFHKIPVTDLNSGFTFKNLSIFKCNSMPDANLTYWKINFDKFDLSKQGELTNDALLKVDFSIFPPSKLQMSKRNTLCSSEKSTSKKLKESQDATRYLSTSLLKGFDSLCGLCSKNHVPTADKSRSGFRHQFTFPILASLEKNQLIFQIEASYAGSEIIPWYYLNCSDSTKGNTGNVTYVTECSVLSCNINFEKRPDGQCKRIYILQLALPEDDVPMTNLFLQHLSYFLECYLTTYAGYDVFDRWHISEQLYNSDLQREFYVTQLLLFSVTEISISKNLDSTLKYFTHFAKAFHYLRWYRTTLNISKVQTSDEKPTLRSFNFENLPIFHMNSHFFVSPSTNEKKTTLLPVCARFVPKSSLKYPALDDVFLECAFMSDGRGFFSYQEQKLASHNDTCLRIFNFPKNIGKKLSVSLLFYFCYTVGLFFIDLL
ncbi:death inducer-obliterator 1 [Biomphalaria glabrata]|nr:hypothetical protein BgiMline_032456 [Biomphalaria glabrata]